jgi:hypothetical protein
MMRVIIYLARCRIGEMRQNERGDGMVDFGRWQRSQLPGVSYP